MSSELLKEAARVEKLMTFDATTSARPHSSKRAPSQAIASSLDALLDSLNECKARIEAGATSADVVAVISRSVDERKKEIEDRQKEVYNALGKLGKAIDKRFTAPLPEWSPMFTSPSSAGALDRTVALHLIRTGQFAAAATFVEESGVRLTEDMKTNFLTMHAILDELRNQNLVPALKWAADNRLFLQHRGSRLEFCLYRSQFMRMLFACHPQEPLPAISHLIASCGPLLPTYKHEINRLLTCTVFLPQERMRESVYADLTDPSIHSILEKMLTEEFCAKLGMSKHLPLRVVGDIGAGGALARIEKARRVMRERKSEWSQTDELPIEIPLPPENRYHSIFACPVSKEQSTLSNPPMMMTCGHVVSKESLSKLTKPGGRVKCPYCPAESKESSALQVHF